MHYPLRDGELFCTLSHCNLMSLSVSILNPPPTTNPTSPKSARLLQPIKDPLKVIFKVPPTSVSISVSLSVSLSQSLLYYLSLSLIGSLVSCLSSKHNLLHYVISKSIATTQHPNLQQLCQTYATMHDTNTMVSYITQNVLFN